MWTSDQIKIEIEEVENFETLVAITTPAGSIGIMGGVSLVDGVLTVRQAHIQGLSPGALTRAGLNAIGYKILEETGAKALIIQGSTRTSGRLAGKTPRHIRFPR